MNDFPNKSKPTGNQDVVNRVAEYFIEGERTRCMDSLSCVYRSNDGQHACAVGCLLPDEVLKTAAQPGYNLTSIGGSIQELCDDSPAIKAWFENCDFDLLENLQQWHDGYGTAIDWLKPGDFVEICEDYNLQVPQCVRDKI